MQGIIINTNEICAQCPRLVCNIWLKDIVYSIAGNYCQSFSSCPSPEFKREIIESVAQYLYSTCSGVFEGSTKEEIVVELTDKVRARLKDMYKDWLPEHSEEYPYAFYTASGRVVVALCLEEAGSSKELKLNI